MIGEHIICSKIGYGRAILDENHKDVIPLSEEQKPKHEKEKKGIEEKGGEVRQLEDEDVHYRVFSKGEQNPGIAMNRSIGIIYLIIFSTKLMKKMQLILNIILLINAKIVLL